MTSDASIVIGIEGRIEGGRVVKRTLDDVAKSGEAAQSKMGGLKNQIGSLNSAAQTLGNTLRTLGLALGVREITRLADTYSNVQNRLKLVTDSADELSSVYKDLLSISVETRSSLEATVTLYSRLTFATKGLGVSQSEVLLFTEQLNKQLAISGLSAQEAAATVFQLTQAFNKGKLDGDEFRTVLEAAPLILEALQKSLQKTRGEILQLAADGQLGPSTLIEAINSMASITDQRFSEMTATFSQSFEILRTKTIDAVGELDSALGIVDFLGFSIVKLGDIIGVVFNDLAALANFLRGVFEDAIGGILSITTVMTNRLEDVINFFRSSKIDLNGGLTLESIGAAQTEMSSKSYAAAGSSLLKANQSALSFAGYTSPARAISARPGGSSLLSGGGGASSEIDKQAEKEKKAIDSVTASLKFNLEQLKRNNVEQAVYNNLRQAGTTINTAAGQEIANLTRTYEQNSAQLQRQEQIVDSLTGVTEGFFQSWFTGAEGFKGAIKGMIGQLADLAFQMSVIEPIKKNLFGSSGGAGGILTSLLGGIFGGGGASAAAARGAANPALFGPGFASGGSMVLGGNPGVDRNQLSLNGAPIARVGRGEVLSISPNRSSGGGITVNQTINLSMGVAEAVAAQFASYLPQIEKSTKAAINEANSRGIAA